MRSRLIKLPIVLAAALALTAVTASAALAAPEYYIKHGGTSSKVTETLPVLLTGKYEVVDNEEGGLRPYGVSCTITNKQAKIKAAGAGELTELGAPSVCEGNHECKKVGLETWETLNMPWTTALFTEGTETRNKITGSALGEAIFQFRCLGVSRNCPLPKSVHIKNGTAEVEGKSQGVVENEFDTKGGTISCTGGKGEWKGALKFELTKADREKFTSTEGLEVK